MNQPKIFCDGTALPAPAREGLHVTLNRLWSQNAGRNTATGDFIGDIIAQKYTVSITYDSLTEEEMQQIWALVGSSAAFHDLQFPMPDGTSKKARGYFADPESVLRWWDARHRKSCYGSLTLEFVEK